MNKHDQNTKEKKENDKITPSVYFMGGNDLRQLPQKSMLQLQKILEDQKPSTSILLFNPVEAMRKVAAWRKSFPWIQPYFAVKANPLPQLLQFYTANEVSFDCASREEIEQVLATGVSAQRIVYSNPIKEQSHLRWAQQKGVQITTADTIEELHKIKTHAPKMRILWRLSIQEEPIDQLTASFFSKFGDDLTSSQQMHQRLSQIKGLGVNLKGVHFHCGSGFNGASTFDKAVLKARLFIAIGRKYDHEMSVMDVGGGFPAGELNQKIIFALNQTKDDPLKFEVIAEPGRHFCSQMFYLVCKVIGKRIKKGKVCYHINDSLYHTFICNRIDVNCFKKAGNQFYGAIDGTGNFKKYDEQEKCTLFGMTCDGVDIISSDIFLPKGLQLGDWLCVSAMGAYTFSCKSNFNGLKSTELIFNFPVYFENPKVMYCQFQDENAYLFGSKASIIESFKTQTL